jgi:hypothetical protein
MALASWPLFVLAGNGGLDAPLLTTRIALANSRSLTTQSSQVIELCTSHTSSLHEIDVIDDGGMEWEYSFNPNPEARLANGNCFSRTAVLARNDHTFKRLQALLRLRFLNANVNAHGIARLKGGNIIAQLAIFDVV